MSCFAPSGRVIANVLPDTIQIVNIADDLIEIVPLPDPANPAPRKTLIRDATADLNDLTTTPSDPALIRPTAHARG